MMEFMYNLLYKIVVHLHRDRFSCHPNPKVVGKPGIPHFAYIFFKISSMLVYRNCNFQVVYQKTSIAKVENLALCMIVHEILECTAFQLSAFAYRHHLQE